LVIICLNACEISRVISRDIYLCLLIVTQTEFTVAHTCFRHISAV